MTLFGSKKQALRSETLSENGKIRLFRQSERKPR